MIGEDIPVIARSEATKQPRGRSTSAWVASPSARNDGRNCTKRRRPASLLQAVPRLLARSDLCVRAYLGLCDGLGQTPRNDISWRHLDRWLREAEPHAAASSGRRILLFALHPRWVDLSLALAVVLTAAGDEVDLAWLPVAHHLPDWPDPLLYRFWLNQGRAIQRRFRHKRLRLIDLAATEPALADRSMRAAAAEQARLDAGYALRRERLDLSEGSADRAQLKARTRANLDAVRRVAALLDAGSHDSLLLPSGGILEFGAVHRYARAHGIPVTSFEFPDARGRILAAGDRPVVHLPTASLWAGDSPHALTSERRARIVAQLIERRQAGADAALPSFQRAAMTDAGAARARLNIPEDGRPVVLVCANVPFDAIQYATDRPLFDGMWQWLVETCRHLAARADCPTIVRAHPAEPMFDTPESAAALLAEAVGEPPPHFRFVAPTDPVNTFAIMSFADIGLVYASTTGLEMAMRGIPVICGNPAQHYNGKGFTIDPESREDYFARIDRLLARPERLSERQVELALSYADIYFNRWPRAFPWQLVSFWRDLRDYPVARLASPEGRRDYGEAIELLRGGA